MSGIDERLLYTFKMLELEFFKFLYPKAKTIFIR